MKDELKGKYVPPYFYKFKPPICSASEI